MKIFDPDGYLKGFLKPRVSHIGRHIGKSPSDLIDRIYAVGGPSHASAFMPGLDVPAAIRGSLNREFDRIRETLSHPGSNDFEYLAPLDSCGLSVLWDGHGLVARTSNEYKVVLAKDPSMRFGFFVMTAYPIFSMAYPEAPVDLEKALLGSASFRAPAMDSMEALKKGAMRASAYLGESIPVVNTRNTVQALLPVSGRGLPPVSVAARIDRGRLTATQFVAVRRTPGGSTLISAVPAGVVGASAAECLLRMFERDSRLKTRLHRASHLVQYPKAPVESKGRAPTRHVRGMDRTVGRTPPPPEPPGRGRDDGLEL